MSLIKCPDCKKRISTKAKSCPNCGRPITKEDLSINRQANVFTGVVLIAIIMFTCFGTSWGRSLIESIRNPSPSPNEYIESDYGRDPKPKGVTIFAYQELDEYQELTGKEKDVMVFWNRYCLDRQKLGMTPDRIYYNTLLSANDVGALGSGLRKTYANQDLEKALYEERRLAHNAWLSRAKTRQAEQKAMSKEEWIHFARKRGKEKRENK